MTLHDLWNSTPASHIFIKRDGADDLQEYTGTPDGKKQVVLNITTKSFTYGSILIVETAPFKRRPKRKAPAPDLSDPAMQSFLDAREQLLKAICYDGFIRTTEGNRNGMFGRKLRSVIKQLDTLICERQAELNKLEATAELKAAA